MDLIRPINASKYFDKLEDAVKIRYLDKIAVIRNLDPFSLQTGFTTEVGLYPPITSDHIQYYLLFTTCHYTFHEFMAAKGMAAENYLASGKVYSLKCRRIGEYYLLKAFVAPSMKSDSDRDAWVICDSAGVVEAAHCTCMAGLGEACSHVAAILWAVMHLREHEVIKSVTDKSAYWKLPSKRQKTDMSEVAKINWSTPQKLIHQLKTGETNGNKRKSRELKYPIPTEDEFMEALQELKKAGVYAPIHAVSEPFASEKAKEKPKLPPSLRHLFKDEHFSKNLDELRAEAAQLNISVTYEEVAAIEEATRKQSKSKKWFNLTAGKVRASLLYKCCHTDLNKPAYSTVIQSCNPFGRRFSTRATRYGCDHEKHALQDYANEMKVKHEGFIMINCGTFTHPDFPEFTATPDSIVGCLCCGEGCVEVKCPVCREDFDIDQVRHDLENNGAQQYLLQTLCEKTGKFSYRLKENHPYYYQVQAQMFLSNRDYCDFVMWTGKCFIKTREIKNELFWMEVSEKGRNFFYKVLLPELLGKWYTRQHNEKTKNKKNARNENSVVKGVKKLSKAATKKLSQSATVNMSPSNNPTATPKMTPSSIVARTPLKVMNINANAKTPATPVSTASTNPPSTPATVIKVLQIPADTTPKIPPPSIVARAPLKVIKINVRDSFYQRLLIEPSSPKPSK